MRTTHIIQALTTLFIPVILASPINHAYIRRHEFCLANDCYRALTNDVFVASRTCSEVLAIATPTVTITQYDFAATQTNVKTVYAATTTITVAPSNSQGQPRAVKRQNERIQTACGGAASPEFTGACNCLVGIGVFNVSAPAPITTTVHITIDDAIKIVASTTTATDTLTVTQTCSPTGNAVVNEDFHSRQLSPWYIAPPGPGSEPGNFSIVEDLTLPNEWPHRVFNASVFKTTGFSQYSKVNIAQNLKTCPGVDYNLSFSYRFEGNAGRGSYLVTFIGGMKVTDINNGPSTWTRVGPIPFKATSFTTELRVDLVNAFFTPENLYLGLFDVSPA
ncbi:hypothetical protein TWF106_007911 [Orbilia oligospora]|uniref:CBM-cenC domain-containing protein n=1 Tax=Orbilia oligospora TaxID=2813651 RepID=A0A6G1M6R2_ORBOL|nr:hypothetical protein TWF788_004355 [Orbilia oligospora]KAF3217605.1 hypothetical protein TWF106_007911 [Orbilia oligospora]KAF3245812.1 hypothetical protein TWF192_007288 [Orbilia oligospora]